MKTVEQIFEAKTIVPTIGGLLDPTIILPLTTALVEGGAKMLSVRLLQPQSFKVISLIKEHFPDLIIGAAGIMDAADFFNASLAGADIISSPGSTPEIFTAARTRYNSAPFVPGVISPSEVMSALSQGFNVLQLFPVSIMDGYDLAATYSHTFHAAKFVMGGGITFTTAERYLSLSNVIAIGMSEITNSQLVHNKDFTEIRQRMEQAVLIANAAQAAATYVG
jgi:2-dehydro-3-deoxyphosphogluconate aldolase/(4S)-4-hydroxy-2-oxoglutarate aldolase